MTADKILSKWATFSTVKNPHSKIFICLCYITEKNLMKNFTYIFLFFILVIISTSFIFSKKTFTPPGTVKISDKLFFDETEITNFNWGEYLYWKKIHFGDSSREYKASLPDTLVWLDSSAYNKPYVEYYFSHPAYRNYPVVGISYEQAVDFCKWRTDRVLELHAHQHKKDYIPNKFQYRLPTKAEWETVAKAGYDEKTFKIFESKKYKGMARANLTRPYVKNTAPQSDNADVTAPVYSYWANSYGLWQIIGNVSEMISEKGIAKGGSWHDKENEVSVEKDYSYNKPKSWLGFRCVCEILEE